MVSLLDVFLIVGVLPGALVYASTVVSCPWTNSTQSCTNDNTRGLGCFMIASDKIVTLLGDDFAISACNVDILESPAAGTSIVIGTHSR